jgi:hypothetical protein
MLVRYKRTHATWCHLPKTIWVELLPTLIHASHRQDLFKRASNKMTKIGIHTQKTPASARLARMAPPQERWVRPRPT